MVSTMGEILGEVEEEGSASRVEEEEENGRVEGRRAGRDGRIDL